MNFQKYLATNIKEIISEYPAVGSILEAAQIGCTTCTVGTCPLGEIVNVHNLSPEVEKQLLTDIAAVLLPGEPVEIPLRKKTSVAEKSLCPPIRKMIEEHEVITRFISCIPEICRTLKLQKDHQQLMKCVEFIKEYADGYHHAKEEAVLFTFFRNSREIIDSFLREHEIGRGFVKEIARGINTNDMDSICESFSSYSQLLTEHISKENSILFPWMNRTLSDKEIGVLFARCSEVDEQYGTKAADLEMFVLDLENVR